MSIFLFFGHQNLIKSIYDHYIYIYVRQILLYSNISKKISVKINYSNRFVRQLESLEKSNNNFLYIYTRQILLNSKISKNKLLVYIYIYIYTSNFSKQ